MWLQDRVTCGSKICFYWWWRKAIQIASDFDGRLFTLSEIVNFQFDTSHPLESPSAWKVAFRKLGGDSMGRKSRLQLREAEQCSQGDSSEANCYRITCWIHNPYCVVFSYRSRMSMYVACHNLELLKPSHLKTEPNFRYFLLSEVQKWMAKESEQLCNMYFLTCRSISCP